MGQNIVEPEQRGLGPLVEFSSSDGPEMVKLCLEKSAPAVRKHPGAWPILDWRTDVKNRTTVYQWLKETVATRDRTTGCWLDGPQNLDTYGYRRVCANGKHAKAHRVALVLDGRPMPDDASHALHSCHNRACVNPDHLRWGTNADNMADMHNVGRGNRSRRGERNGSAKLTEAQVRFILSSNDPVSRLAERFGVGQDAVFRIRGRRSWRHVTLERN